MVVDALKDVRRRAAAEHPEGEEGALRLKAAALAESLPIPDDLWVECTECRAILLREDLEKDGSVCSGCGYHFRIGAPERIGLSCDPGSFQELEAGLVGHDPIGFPGYADKLRKARRESGLPEAAVTGRARIGGEPCLVGVLDSRFMMGSMGTAVGERVVRLFETATRERLPVVFFSASGGARMQEGILSLMQMARTAAAVTRHQEEGLLYLSVLTDPTTGGVTASFASLGSLVLAEPGALVGFAGRRVIEGTIAQKLPDDFQRAEFLMKHGFVDAIVPRRDLKAVLARLLRFHRLPRVPDLRPTDGLGENAAGSLDVAAPSEPLPASVRLDLIRKKGRPTFRDYLPLLFDEVMELHGDRSFADDPAIWGGLARIGGRAVTVLAHIKGRDLTENQAANFGMAHPEGYRKAIRLMKEAERCGRPVLCVVDTPGAYCGVGAEERGEGEAIARSIACMTGLRVPILGVVTGEGGSGGALALAAGDRLGMLSNALYSVISPRGFASILWKDPTREREAADAARITAEDLKDMGICDDILPEPEGGAGEDLAGTAGRIRDFFLQGLAELDGISGEDLLALRYERYRRLHAGADVEPSASAL